MKVTLAHMRSMRAARPGGYCVRGARAFADRHGLDWRAFCREGIDEEVLLATGDAMARAVVELAHSQARGEK